MDAKTAKRLSMKNGFDEKIQNEIKNLNKRIERACKNGQTSVCAFNCDADKSDVEFKAKEHFVKQGFTFRPTGIVGGVYQRTEDICW